MGFGIGRIVKGMVRTLTGKPKLAKACKVDKLVLPPKVVKELPAKNFVMQPEIDIYNGKKLLNDSFSLPNFNKIS